MKARFPRLHMLAVAVGAMLAAIAGIDDARSSEPCATPIQPVELHYRLLEGGRERGRATARIVRSDRAWEYRFESRARVGILPVSMNESTRFQWEDNRPRPTEYLRTSRGGPFRRSSSANFDWGARQSNGRHKGEDWTLPLEGDELDRLSIQLATATALAQGATTLTFTYIDRGEFRSMQTRPYPVEPLTTPAGEFQTIRVERDRGDRTTRVFHAVELDYLPVRIEHIDEDDRYTLVLESWRALPCQ